MPQALRQRTHYALLITFALLLLSLPCPAQHGTNAAAEAKLKQLQVAPGLKVELVAAEPLLQNPVAFSVDERGRFFVAETHRWKGAVFDITKQVTWLLDDLSCRTVADREAHLHRLFPGTNYSVLTNASEVIRLVEDTDGDGRADKSTVIADGFNLATAGPAAGILARNGEVWFACVPELWRITNLDLRITSPSPSGTPLVNRKSQIGNQFGVHISVSGHDLHGLVFGPDGRLYFSLGDRGFELRPGMKHPGFSADYLRRIAPDTGAVFRCQPDGSELEVFCIGLRNPQGLAFDALGNLFTVDNDTAGPDKPRLLHLVEGGDYGWRISYQHMKNFGPWVTENLWVGGTGDILPWSGEVAQGPAGLAFYPGTGLPDRYANHFFICDFPGGIWSFSLKPRGASFELAAREKFLWNLLPTHAAFGPDGALYVSDWVEGWGQPEKGRIYRVSDPAQAGSAKLAEVNQTLKNGILLKPSLLLYELLSHPDLRVRLAAQEELALQESERVGVIHKDRHSPLTGQSNAEIDLGRILTRATNTAAQLHSVWGLGKSAAKLFALRGQKVGPDERPLGILSKLNTHTNEAVRAAAVSTLGSPRFYCFLRHTDLLPFLKDASPLVRCAAAMSLARAVGLTTNARGERDSPGLNPPQQAPLLAAVSALLKGNANTDPYLTHAGMMALLGIGDFEAIQRAARDESPAVRRAAMLCMQRLLRPEIAQFLHDPDPRLVLEASRIINDVGIESAYPELASLLDTSGRRREESPAGKSEVGSQKLGVNQSLLTSAATVSVLRRALNAHYRIGQATNAQALATFSNDTNVSDALRAEALYLLSAWDIQPATPGNVPVKIARVDGHGSTPLVNPENWPGWFDHVCGLWRPLPPRNADAARDALRPHLASLLQSTRTNTQLATIAAVEKLTLSEAAPHLAALLKSTAQPAPVRVASLRTIGRMASPSLLRSGGEGRGEEVRPAGTTSSTLPNPLPARASQGEGAGGLGLSALLSDSVTLALSDSDATVRREAVKLAGIANPATAIPLLEQIITAKADARLVQSALSALGDLPGVAADQVLAKPLQLLRDGNWLPESELELIEAAAKRPAGPATEALKRYLDTRSKNDDLAAFRPALVGGDSEAGKQIFFEHVGVQCLRCHAIRGEGGIVGPGLTSVGKRLTREQILESIVLPNKTIAAGFENATLVLKGGANHSGLVKSENATELVLDSPEDGKLTLKKADIEKRIRGLSAMPEGLDKLMTRRELRDLVEFLSSLK